MSRIIRLLLVAVLALTTQTRWESEAAGIQALSKYFSNQGRRRVNFCLEKIIRGGGEKHSRSKHHETVVDAQKSLVDPEKSPEPPTDNAVGGAEQPEAVPEEEERFGYLKIAEREIREAEIKQAKRNKEIDDYFDKREKGEIKLTEEQVLFQR
jgi:hypothetical protein